MIFHTSSIKNRIAYIFSWLILFVCFSCTQDLNINIQTNDKRLIVVGEFTSDTIIHSVKLYCSGSLVTGEPQKMVSGARIFITDNIDTIYYKESNSTPGSYFTTSKCFGKGGQTYFLSITNIDIDNDGKMDSFVATEMMPIPVKFDSLVSKYGINGDHNQAINNLAYFKIMYNGPDYLYKYTQVNNQDQYTITDQLGSGEFTRFEKDFKMIKVNNPGSFQSAVNYLSINNLKAVKIDDTITFVGYNLTTNQFNFLKTFDDNTGDSFKNNFQDQLSVPVNLPTNIQPSEKAAGYFMIYSISKISTVFKTKYK